MKSLAIDIAYTIIKKFPHHHKLIIGSEKKETALHDAKGANDGKQRERARPSNFRKREKKSRGCLSLALGQQLSGLFVYLSK